MSDKANKIVYWASTGILTALMLMSVSMYVLKHDEISAVFEKLGYPSYIVYPLAGAKILGLIAIWTRKSITLKEWAYAGFFFDFVLAAAAHIVIEDSGAMPAMLAMLLLITSYVSGKKAFG